MIDIDVSNLNDAEIDDKIKDIGNKRGIAYRLGNMEVLHQLNYYYSAYIEEQQKRQKEALKNSPYDNEINGLINVE